MKNLATLEKLAGAIIYFAIFVFSIYQPLDPDLGWHLKYGEYFFQHGLVLRDNTFSALMPDFRWVNSSWATDLLTYQAFHNFGFLGIAILGAIVITLTLYFLGKASKLDIFEKSIIFPVLLFLTSSVNQFSFRGQILSLLFMSVMFWILSRYDQKSKFILLLIPLFILWSNFHGQFIFGLGIFFIWIIVYSAKELYLDYGKRLLDFFSDNHLLFISLVGSFLGAFINPFGAGAYLEALGHFDDPVQKFVTEFLPPADFSTTHWNLLFVGTGMIMGLSMLGIGKKILDKAPFYFPSMVLFIFSFWVRRYAWPFYYSSVFLLQPVVAFLKPESKKYAVWVGLVFSALFIMYAIYAKYPFSEIRNASWETFCVKSIKCSPTASQAVIDNKLNNEKLLTIYDYGGYLIWNYPDITPTIDGRMHLWRDENGYSAFEDYYPIERNWRDIDSSAYNAVLTSRQKPIYFHLVKLVRQGKWKVVHVDKLSALFVRTD